MRADGRAHSGQEFARLVLVTHADGSRVRLGDVARVSDGFAESDERLRFDGEPAVMVRLLESGLDDVLAASGAVRAYLEQLAPRLPSAVAVGIWSDESLDFASRRDLLVRNGLQGLALIFAILALFLRPRLAFWVTLGIPIAFLGAMIGLSLTGQSINMMSMFAFIVALGLIVDDSIIVGENVARHQARTSDARAGAISGARGVMVPVLIAVLTTMLFIAPDLALPTAIGKVAFSLGVVVIGCLAFSLVESLLVLPAHLASGPRAHGGMRRGVARALERVQSRVDAWLDHFIAHRYRPALERALCWPALTLTAALALLLVSLGAVAGGWIPRAFFPQIEVDTVSVRVAMPEGTAPRVISAAVRHLEECALEVGRELEAQEGKRIFKHVLAVIGDRPDHHDSFATGGEGANVGHVAIQLVPGEQRSVTSLEVKERWRERAGVIPGARSVVYRGSEFSWNRPIDVALSSRDPEVLSEAAAELVAALAATPGVREIADSQSGGKQELSLRIRPEAEAMGLSLAEAARQVRQGFHGEQVQHLYRGREEVAVVVRYPRGERRSIADLENVRIRLPGGGELPFSAVAEAAVTSGYAAIERRDRRRTVRVSADVDYDVTSPAAVLAGLAERDFPRIAAAHEGGVSFDLDGQSRDETEMTKALERGFLLALVASYALLAVPMRSYLQPLLILVAIPFGLVGAIAAHAALGLQISAFSLIGLIALTGVVVNDALLLIERANRRRAEGASAVDALLDAGTTRFRPILLTSLTTFFGLLPLLFEDSAQAEWLKPMAATLAFGVMGATFITLLIVPAAYVALEALEEGVAALKKPLTLPAPERSAPRGSQG
jgi:multidrug efflux pump subunit AcrB